MMVLFRTSLTTADMPHFIDPAASSNPIKNRRKTTLLGQVLIVAEVEVEAVVRPPEIIMHTRQIACDAGSSQQNNLSSKQEPRSKVGTCIGLSAAASENRRRRKSRRGRRRQQKNCAGGAYSSRRGAGRSAKKADDDASPQEKKINHPWRRIDPELSPGFPVAAGEGHDYCAPDRQTARWGPDVIVGATRGCANAKFGVDWFQLDAPKKVQT